MQVLIRQKHSWRRNYTSVLCNDVSIATGQIVLSGTGSVACYTGGSCPSFTTLSADVYCTDYSIGINYSSGEEFNVTTLPLNGSFTIAFGGGNWMALAIGGNANWTITGRIDLRVRPDGILNTSPVTTTLPVIYKTIGVQHVHVVQMSDADNTDTLRCRWSTNNIPPNWNNYDECNSVCAPSLPLGYTLIAENCTIVFTLNAANFFAVALQIEDFYTPTSPTPMSSVPIQFLFYGYYPPSGCSTAPTIIGVRPNLGEKILFLVLLLQCSSSVLCQLALERPSVCAHSRELRSPHHRRSISQDWSRTRRSSPRSAAWAKRSSTSSQARPSG